MTYNNNKPFHLSALEKAELVTSQFAMKNEPNERPVVANYYELTPKGKEILEKLKLFLPSNLLSFAVDRSAYQEDFLLLSYEEL